MRMGRIAPPQPVTGLMSHHVHLFTPLSHWVPSRGQGGGMKPGWLCLTIQAGCPPTLGGAIHTVAMSSCRGKPFAPTLWRGPTPVFSLGSKTSQTLESYMNKYLVSIYNMRRAPSLTIQGAAFPPDPFLDMLYLAPGIHTTHLGSIKAVLRFCTF